MQVNEFSNDVNIFATCITINRPIHLADMMIKKFLLKSTNWNVTS